jgi:proteasome lid subunit RPN8/RPN11
LSCQPLNDYDGAVRRRKDRPGFLDSFGAGRTRMWLADLKNVARRLLSEMRWPWSRQSRSPAAAVQTASQRLQPLRRVLLTDAVSRTLFEEYAAHRASGRGAEETGWMLLGRREGTDAVALATLPAGTKREAGVAHVQFSSPGQAVASRIVRQHDRTLTALGVVHTHPGTLRHPSDGDFRGDIQWVGQLRGQEGIFGIGTADGNGDGLLGRHPRPHVQMLGDLCLSWYSLRQGDRQYRPLPVELVLGPDLARPLHSVWPMIESHAPQLDRLARQQAGLAFDLANDRPALTVKVPLAEPGDAILVVIEEKQVRYLLFRRGEYLETDSPDPRIDRSVYLMLAELAGQG